MTELRSVRMADRRRSKAVIFTEFGSPDVLRYVDVEEPHPGPGEVRIGVRAAGVNPLDVKVRRGVMEAMFPTALPHVLGMELAGVVDEIGEGVDDWKVGDEVVAWPKNGSYREFAIADSLIRKPAKVPWEVAGAIGIAAETAARALDLLAVAPGGTLLVHAAAGGVGSVAAQIAKARDINVIGTAGVANHDYLRALGVTPVTYGDGLAERVRAVAPDGVDWAFDCAGHDALPASIELTGSPERVLTIGDRSAQEYGVPFSLMPANPRRDVVVDALAMVLEGTLQLNIERAYPLSEAAAAHGHSETGHLRGKIVLIP
jgi:NADPH:quinone reductase-like Zn-dependent oxidoreductase